MKKHLITLCILAMLLSCNKKDTNEAAIKTILPQQKNNSQKHSIVNGAMKRMAGNYMTMPITPLCLEVRNFQNNEATYAYSSEIQKES
jgi:hypothetical protein